jgi:putative membrane protein
LQADSIIMIIRSRPHGLFLFFTLTGSIVPRILRPMAATIGIAIAVTWAHGVLFSQKVTLTPIPFSLIGLALAIFLGFRNSASYDRFWEGRKLWGELVIDARSLARQMICYLPMDEESKRRAVLRLIAFTHALRHHLRDTDPMEDISPLLGEDEAAAAKASHNRPDALLRQASAELARQMGKADPMMLTEMERRVWALAGIQAGCERIKYTPLPFSYALLLHRTAYLYCFALPFGLVDSIGFMTPFVVAIVSYTFFGLDALGDEIEEPFGIAPNDLPLASICRTIERDLLAALGETELPPPTEAQSHCLL